MPLTFEGIDNGVKQFRDLETGEKLFSEETLDNALNTFGETIGDKDLLRSKLGETIFENARESRRGTWFSRFKDTGPYHPSKDLEGRKFDIDNAGTGNKKTINPGTAPRSQFNPWALFRYRSIMLGNENDDSNSPDLSKAINSGKEDLLNPSAKKIVEECGKMSSFGHSYQLKDFVQCEHYGTISNNYMVTLRRFPYPTPDDIFSPKQFGADGKPIETQQPDIARAITWMSPSLGNELKDIFSFGTGYNWKDVEAEVQTVQSRTDRGKIGARISASPILSAFEAGAEGYDAVSAARKRELGGGYDPLSNTYPNHVYGPLNVIKSMMIREKGINFDKEFTLNFYYDLKAYGNVSPKAAFMDTLSNLLVLTTNNAPFWGGATRGVGGGAIGKPFGDLKKLQSGDYEGFLTGIADQFATMAGNIKDDLLKGGKSKILNNIIGGGLMELFGSPQGTTVMNAFLTGDPTGQWHITVGNPLNPAMVIGNLGLQNAKFEFEGPLGYEDFPTKLKVTVTLKPGRPRDKTEIESMFNSGKSRMYLQPEGADGIRLYNQGAYGDKKFGANMESNASDMAFG